MRQASLEKENDDLKSETFSGVLRVSSPARTGLVTNRKRVLRGPRVTSAAKRRQRSVQAVRSSLETNHPRGPTAYHSRKATPDRRATRWPGLAEVKEQGMHVVDSPGTWETSTSPRELRKRTGQTPRRQDASIAPALSVDAAWYRRPKATKGARNGGRGVGASRSTDEAGEPRPRGPGGGKGEQEYGTAARNDDGTGSR